MPHSPSQPASGASREPQHHGRAQTLQRPIWVLTDGKPGHENQSRGLAESLSIMLEKSIEYVKPISSPRALSCIGFGRIAAPDEWRLPPDQQPDLVLAAGHSTHNSLLAAKRCFHAKAIILMKPSMPYRFFDLCVVPRHDDPPDRHNVIATWGALNHIRPSSAPRSDRRVLLLGGPSKHHAWNNESVLAQIQALLAAAPDVQWTATTSRRTPDSFVAILNNLREPHLYVVPWTATPPDWVAAQLATCAEVWVTEDSVSMVYEALSSGAGVGLIHVDRISDTRVVRGIDDLIQHNVLTTFTDWRNGRVIETDPEKMIVLREADRVAKLIVDRWYSAFSRGIAE
ncbi:MAG TPA: mitochondrial fission ELM1 family protein [Phycisphaerales bacterium]|nr:mitochondrial fission ELM1 family protein [Phycisphaerales bacterium]HRQ75270.1 mitochondrial fission ELM1 family protein [Phycisphaerales bacterium]